MPFNNKRNSRDDKSGKSRPSSYPKRNSGDRNFEDRKGNYSENNSPRPYNRDRDERPSRDDRSSNVDRRGDRNREERSGNRPAPYNNRPYQEDRRPFNGDRKRYSDDSTRSDRTTDNRKTSYGDRDRYNRNDRPFNKGDRPYNSREERPYKNDRPSDRDNSRPPYREKSENRFDDRKRRPSYNDREGGSRPRKGNGASRRYEVEPKDDGLIRLNRYIANSGVCSRRKADELIAAGVIMVNNEVVTELGVKVDPSKDEIRYNGERLKREKMVYVLLNKPKDFITTTDDPQERRTVMQLVEKASDERIYPVGRLDRNTTGLLLMTNDGNLAEKLSHPRNNITKIYQVELNKGLTQGDFNKLEFGIELEDGFIKPDDLSYVQGGSKREVGIQIHSGKNRIVRRMFESLGYDVIKLDRVVYGSLTKKDLPRGRWRYLEEREIIQLKHLIN
ncbi:pseudouridine synthase [Olivibacter sitiensis]|uniref:pseudouridine synthase n=1 Tax=Olivibacter sitiensis TaxID=376470 RepID=UPI0003FA2F96|nr:pseudouridine synthase [Olivibacter sitiensis]